MPSVIGLTAEQARQKLADAGLYMRATGATEYGSHVVAYEQSTAAGASVNRGTTIEVRLPTARPAARACKNGPTTRETGVRA